MLPLALASIKHKKCHLLAPLVKTTHFTWKNFMFIFMFMTNGAKRWHFYVQSTQEPLNYEELYY